MQRIVYLILVLLAALFASIILYKKVTSKNCPVFNFSMPEKAYVNDKIMLYDSTESATSWQWDYGDGSEPSSIQNPSHSYKKPGIYTIKLTINGICDDFKNIHIEAKPVAALELAHIQGPAEATVGQSVKFTELTSGATSYEWLFSESGKVDARTQSPSYAFKTPGYKTVTVYVNGPKGRTSGTLTVNVKAKEAASAPAMPSAPADNSPKYSTQEKQNIVTNAFSDFISSNDDVVRNKALEKMKPFICSADIPVYKNEKSATGIIAFCKDLQNRNKTCKVKNLSIDWNNGSDCLKAVHLEYKEK